MIYDELKNSEKYCSLNEKFKKAFDFLKNTDLKNIVDGKIEIDKDNIFANVQTLKTKQKELKKWEVHRKYIDIQYIIKGQEKMGYGLLDNFSKTIVQYDENKDIAFLDGDKYNYIDVDENQFVIFYPTDTHAPMLSVNEDKVIKKVIVKILI